MAEERKRNELEAAVTAFRDAEPEERTAMNAALTQTEAGILDGLAQEAAEKAVRENDPERIRFGLAALALEGGWPDWRDTTVILTLLHVSARKLDLDADRVFYEEARALAYDPVEERDYFINAGARLLRSYAGRPDRLKELDVMAYEEYEGPNGFAYREVAGA
ncbi:MAG TPA: hypothetical protein VFG61_03175 [Gaiellaceae bacterium]|jgi:hypothetical protein|nr:hypothetical protein [Gaiellaceae bacterium]